MTCARGFMELGQYGEIRDSCNLVNAIFLIQSAPAILRDLLYSVFKLSLLALKSGLPLCSLQPIHKILYA